jgi:hypothetical protein
VRLPAAFLVCLCSIVSAPVATFEAGEPRHCHYTITARVDPLRGDLQAVVELSGLDHLPTGGTLYLHKSARIDDAHVDGAAAKVTLELDKPAGPYMPQSAPLALPPGTHRTLTLRYTVTLDGIVNDVNTIAADLVELALYASWYPRSPALERFTYDLSVSLPATWTVLANGEPTTNSSTQNSTWRSLTPVDDIVVLACPDLRITGRSHHGARIEIAAPAPLLDRLGPVIDHMQAAEALASSWFDVPRQNGRLCLVFPPRTGWGYSRPPLIITNRAYGESLAANPSTQAVRLKGAYHEMAHFWWAVARSDALDDWINEALAEFTAWRLVRERAGAEPAAAIEAGFRKDALGEKVAVAITASREEPARYVNRYEKGALVFIGVERRFGWPRLQACLRRVLLDARREPMTTDRFLAVVRETIDGTAADYVHTLITAEGWAPALLASVPEEAHPH